MLGSIFKAISYLFVDFKLTRQLTATMVAPSSNDSVLRPTSIILKPNYSIFKKYKAKKFITYNEFTCYN